MITDELEEKTTEHDEDIAILVDMGFEIGLIHRVYLFLSPGNLEEAIQFMTEEDGIYQHNFYRRNSRSSNNNCLICNKEERFHINYRPSIYERFTRPFFREGTPHPIAFLNNKDVSFFEEDEKQENLLSQHCKICSETMNINEVFALSCGHKFCKSCWKRYLEEKISVAKVTKITCMELGCKTVLDEDTIMKFLKDDEKMIEKYQRFKRRAMILSKPNIKYCPFPNCDSFLEKSKDKFVECEHGHQFCYNCLKPWHKQSNCHEEIDKDFEKWRKNKVIKRCPKCKMFTEKNEGCNHMTCGECKFQWCWLCEKEYLPGHFEVGECAGQQFSKSDKPNPTIARYSVPLRNNPLRNNPPRNNPPRNPPRIYRRQGGERLSFCSSVKKYFTYFFALLFLSVMFFAWFFVFFHLEKKKPNFLVIAIHLLTVFFFVIAYQIFFTCLSIVPLFLTFFYPPLIKKIINACEKFST